MDLIPLPQIVYKYRSAKSALEILQQQSVYLPSVSKFNDPFDCKIPINFEVLADDADLQKQFINKFLIEKTLSDAEKQRHIDKIMSNGKMKDKGNLRLMEQARLKKMEEVFSVYCLSVISDNLLLWAHYGDCHEGICIGFDSKKLLDAIKPTWVAPVTYCFKYPKISILEDPENILEIMLFNKSVDWLYEKEIRYVKYSEGGGCEIKIPTDTIVEIHSGCMMTDDDYRQLKELTDQKYPQARLLRYKKDELAFGLKHHKG